MARQYIYIELTHRYYSLTANFYEWLKRYVHFDRQGKIIEI